MPRRKSIDQPVQTGVPGHSPKEEIPNEPVTSSLSGLYIFGQVIDRTRRNVTTRNNNTTEIVTYAVQDKNGRRYFIDVYTPTQYYEVGEEIVVPVYVKTFKKNSVDIGFSFCVQQQFVPNRGEHF